MHFLDFSSNVDSYFIIVCNGVNKKSKIDPFWVYFCFDYRDFVEFLWIELFIFDEVYKESEKLLLEDVLVEIKSFLFNCDDGGMNFALKISFISCTKGWVAFNNPVPLH